MLIDIDDFEWVNTTHGHLVGDMVLRILAATFQRNLRPADTLGRYGGDEFAVICPDVALHDVELLAERIRADVEQVPLCAGGNDFNVTVSIGIAGGRSDQACWGALVEAADRAMYRAKGAGRNAIAAE
jgi:diguanylate cyclase (GGDEF)-like protein